MAKMTIEEFMAKIDSVIAEFPMENEKALKSGANLLQREVVKASPDSGHSHKGKLNKSWRVEMTGFSADNITANIKTVAPHWHLLEKGHDIKNRKGEVVGFKQGTHFFRETIKANIKQCVEGMQHKLYRSVRKKI